MALVSRASNVRWWEMQASTGIEAVPQFGPLMNLAEIAFIALAFVMAVLPLLGRAIQMARKNRRQRG